jgi:hypothetical protein
MAPLIQTKKGWIIFWAVATALLIFWYIFLQIKNNQLNFLRPLFRILPVSQKHRGELNATTEIISKLGAADGREK